MDWMTRWEQEQEERQEELLRLRQERAPAREPETDRKGQYRLPLEEPCSTK